MNVFILLVDGSQLVVDVINNNIDHVVFQNPLELTSPKPNEVVLNVPMWIRCTPDRHFVVNKNKISMILNPTENLKKSYTDIIESFKENAKKETQGN